MRAPVLTQFLALLALVKPSQGTPTPAAEHYLTVSVVSILGFPQHAHRLGPGYIPTVFIDKSLRFAYSGEDWDRQCMEASDTTNGKLVRITDNCIFWQKNALWNWDVKGQIIFSTYRLLNLHPFNRHTENQCLELDEPEYLIDEPSLGEVTLALFYTCDGEPNQQWVALRDTRKIANVAKPNLCLSPVGDNGLLGAVDCRNAKDIGVTKKE
ncbi:hypothetical protein BGX38DRAFT_325801 [Terfezia claveryi]|nr:hypothetical protein BGX38DRAFT_325801 [Terfezia claveryi]